MNKKSRLALLNASLACLRTLAVIWAISSTAWAQVPAPSQYSAEGVFATQKWMWATEPWAGDNTPFHQARLRIEAAALKESSLDQMLLRYKKEAKNNPRNPIAVFQWACAGYQAMLAQNSPPAQAQALDGVEVALRSVPPPHVYDYDRIRFLVGEFYTSHRLAVPLAKRLLAVNPSDYPVAYDLSRIYLDDYVPARSAEALAICNRLKQQYPSKPSIYALTGEAYVLLWNEDKRSSYARQVVNNYQRYLKIAPPNNEFRKRAEAIVLEFKAKSG